jgi:hypothetical protein
VSRSASSEKPQCLFVGPTRPNNRSWPRTVPVKCRHQKNGVSNVQTSPSTICNRCRLRTKDRTVSTQTGVPSRRMAKRRPLKIPSGRMLPRSSPSTPKIGVVPRWGWIRNTAVPGDRSETPLRIGEPKVQQLRAGLGQHDVRGLEIAMDDAGAVRRVERFGDLDAISERRPPRGLSDACIG